MSHNLWVYPVGAGFWVERVIRYKIGDKKTVRSRVEYSAVDY